MPQQEVNQSFVMVSILLLNFSETVRVISNSSSHQRRPVSGQLNALNSGLLLQGVSRVCKGAIPTA
ncbi:MAG: hypothetical protein AAB278_06995, partial [Pseudomonadota bacterium]